MTPLLWTAVTVIVSQERAGPHGSRSIHEETLGSPASCRSSCRKLSFSEFMHAMAASCPEDTFFFGHTFPILWFLRSLCSFFHDVPWALEGMTELFHLVLNTPPTKHSWTFGQLWASRSFSD